MRFGTHIRTAARHLVRVRSLPAWVFSLFLASSQVVGRHVVFSGMIDAGLDQNYMTPLTVIDVLSILVATPLITLLVVLTAEAIDRRRTSRVTGGAHTPPKHPVVAWLVVASILLAAWSPYVLTYAPGSVQPDSLYSISGDRTNHHPIVFTLVVNSFARLGETAGDINYGIFTYTLLQALVIALSLSFGVLWIARKGAPSWWQVATVAYFAVVPVFPIYAINVQKDPLFSIFVASLSLLMYRTAESRGAFLESTRGITTFLAVCALVLFFRNNGVFVVIGSLAALALFFRRGQGRFYASAVALLIVTFLIQGPGYNALEVRRNTFVESIGIPIQQVAYVVSTDGDISPEEKQFLGGLMPYSTWPAVYAPCLVDMLKWHPEFDGTYLNANRPRFIKTWASLFRKNPVAYFRAYCLGTFGFWKIGVNNSYGFADTGVISNSMGVRATDLVERLTGRSIKPLLDGTRGADGAGGYAGAGILIWLTILAAAVLTLRRRGLFAVALAPCIALWLSVMIATPVAFSLRYVFALAICLPAVFLLPFAASTETQRRTSRQG